MTETPEEFRRRVEQIDAKFYEDADKRGAQYRERAFEYEKLTVDFSHKGFQTLADAKFDPLLLWHVDIAFHHAPLDVKRTAHRVYDAAELSQ